MYFGGDIAVDMGTMLWTAMWCLHVQVCAVSLNTFELDRNTTTSNTHRQTEGLRSVFFEKNKIK